MKEARLVVIALWLLCLIGCRKPVEDLQQHTFTDKPLAECYAQLLSNIAWTKLREEGESYIEVSGILRHEQTRLTVRYEAKAVPPVVVHYTLDDAQREPETFAAFLTEAFWRLELRSQH